MVTGSIAPGMLNALFLGVAVVLGTVFGTRYLCVPLLLTATVAGWLVSRIELEGVPPLDLGLYGTAIFLFCELLGALFRERVLPELRGQR